MRAQRFYADTKTFAVEDVPIPEPGPGEVLVKVAFCGICHSDLSLINGTFPAQVPVVTQGHEASGTIAKLGPGVTRLGRGRSGGRGRRAAVPGLPELRARRLRQLPADPVDGVRLRRRLGAVHRGAGVRADPGAGQRATGTGRDPGRRGVHARTARWSAPPRSASANRWACGASAASAPTSCSWPGWSVRRPSSPSTSSRPCWTGPWNWAPTMPSTPATTPWATRSPTVTGGRGLDVAFDAVGLGSTFDQALAGLTIGGRLVGVGMSADAPEHRADLAVQPDPQAGAGPSGLPERRYRDAGQPVVAGPPRRDAVPSATSCHWRTSRPGIEKLEQRRR